ncbi:hypothetical protein [Burkholderia pseudomallei]|uniref:hypothetical protein n=1 Tax=Burkholderia pseudomallei TaxID=28450 RepID=UPI000F57F3DD|nr:hypothetical protein [Burkholderia pseudomallei]MBM5575866.1 hypothetical protein [Burkholderia pseudomallei]MBM5584280.1 hypothetical protein [Burkholderia pseudomallei]RPA00116.1 hypothetical protein EGT86_25290 [Burkholderia pseudomallei]
MPIRQTHIWIFGFVIACVLAMSGPLTYTFENTFQQTVDIDRKKQGTVAEATAFDARSAEQPSASDADRMHELPRIDAARSPTDHFDELPIHLAAFGGGEPSPSGPLPPGPLPDTSFAPFPFQHGFDTAIHAGPPIPAPPESTLARTDAPPRDETPFEPGMPQPSETVDTQLSFYADMVAQAIERTAYDSIALAKLDSDTTAPPDMTPERHDALANVNAPMFYADMLTASIHVPPSNDRTLSVPSLLTHQAIGIAWTELFARELPATATQAAPTRHAVSFAATLQAEPFDLAQWSEPDEAHSDGPPLELDGQRTVAPPYPRAGTLPPGTRPTYTDSSPDTGIVQAAAMLATGFESAGKHAATLRGQPPGADECRMGARAIGLGRSGMERLAIEQFVSSARAAYDCARARIHGRASAFANAPASAQPSNHLDANGDPMRIAFLPRFASEPFQEAFSIPGDTAGIASACAVADDQTGHRNRMAAANSD